MKFNFLPALIIFLISSVFFYLVFSQLQIKEGTFTDEDKIRLLIFSILVGIGNIIIHWVFNRTAFRKKEINSNDKINA